MHDAMEPFDIAIWNTAGCFLCGDAQREEAMPARRDKRKDKVNMTVLFGGIGSFLIHHSTVKKLRSLLTRVPVSGEFGPVKWLFRLTPSLSKES